MTAVLVALADGLAAEINDHDFITSFDFEAESSWADFDDKLEELESLKVDVVPVGHGSSNLKSRGTGDVEYGPTADIIIRYKFPRTDTQEGDGRIDREQINALVALTEQVIEFLYSPQHLELSSYPGCHLDLSAQKPIDPQTIAPRNYLREHRMFLAVLRVTYHIVKEA